MSKKINIGRASDNTVRVDERWDMVSNYHADIERNGDEFTLYDHSTNGTKVNGQEVHGSSMRIYPGQRIVLGKQFELDWYVIKTYLPDEQPAPQPAGGFGRKTVTFDTGGGQEVGKDTWMRDAGHKTEMFDGRPAATEDFRSKVQGFSSDNYGKANEYSQAEIDKAIKKWNWGAFCCTWLWGLFNKTYWPLLFLLLGCIPFLGFVSGIFLCVYLGLNGSKIAWKSGKYSDFESFKRAQRSWAIGGLIYYIVFAIPVMCFTLYAVLNQF